MPFEQALVQAVESEPRKVEQSTSTWTCRELAAYLAHQGHPKVSDETVRRHLHALGYAVIRPVLSNSSPDERYAEKVEKLRAYQAAAKRGEVVLLYEDEIDLHLLPGIAGCWTKRGSQRKVPTPGKNQKRKESHFGISRLIPNYVLYFPHCRRVLAPSLPSARRPA